MAAGMLTAAVPAAAAQPPQIQVFPSPLRFVSNLDLECFRTSPYTPPAVAIQTRHINPVLTNLPVETHVLGPREKLCVPVAKNNILPPPGVIDFVRFVDLSCYRIQGINVNRALNLRHLNPLFATSVAPKNVVITVPQHLCVPVIKNNLMPPPEVFNLVRWIDLKCYAEQPIVPLNRTVSLTQLNPVLANIPTHPAAITYGRQLCVPVIKGTVMPPADVMNIIRWIDLELYDITTPALPTFTLQLRHINPLLGGLPIEIATLTPAIQLGLPVAKNNMMPPA